MAKENKDKLAKIFEQLTGKKFKPPKEMKIEDIPEIETLSEIDKLMREKPNSGRE